MSSKKIIAVVGATGNQGRSVANTFLQSPSWTVRALTRNPSSPAAQALAVKGCEVVRAELDDPSSLEDAFRGAHAIFLNTDFWIPYVKALGSGTPREEASRVAFDTEVRHAKNATDAAVRVAGDTLERLVYSALGPMSKASGGKYPHCLHWETKAVAADYVEAAFPDKASFLYPGAYSTNTFLFPQKYAHLPGGDGVPEYTLLVPAPITAKFPVIREDQSTGPFVRALVEDEEPGLKLLGYDCDVEFGQALEDWKAVTGKDARFLQVTEEQMHRDVGLPFETLDGPAFLGEFDFMAGVEGKVIRPDGLKNKVPVKTYREILEARSIEELVEAQHPKF